MDPETASEKVLTDRLTQVAVQLTKVANVPDKSADEKLDAELEAELQDDTPMVTPSVSPKAPATPAEPVSMSTSVEKVDHLGHRVNQIFGKKRTIEDVGHSASPKVANITVTDAADGGATVAVKDSDVNNLAVDKNIDSLVKNGVEVPSLDGNNVDPDVNRVDDAMDVGNGDDEEDGEWQEAEEEPEAYPEGAFPMQIPGYPMQPTFNYRYRTYNSTPRSRRVDFKNAIVMRNCTRDPYTNRVSQEDYEAREDSEMSLSLGCVMFIS